MITLDYYAMLNLGFNHTSSPFQEAKKFIATVTREI